MPVAVSYPGVYVEEIPSGVRTITGVATSIAAFVDFFPAGPLGPSNAVEVFSFADFERRFGGLDARSEASYAIQQFFLNGGISAYVIRATSTASPAVPAAISLEAAGGPAVLEAQAIDPGAWGNNLRIDIDYNTSDPTTQFNLTVSEIAVSNGATRVVASEMYRNLVIDPSKPNDASAVINGGSQLISVTKPVAAAARPAHSGTLSKPITDFAALSQNATFSVSLTTNSSPTATVLGTTTGLPDPVPTDGPSLASLLQSLIRGIKDTHGNVLLPNATVAVVGSASGTSYLVAKAGTGDPSAILTLGDPVGSALGFVANAQQYALGGYNQVAPIAAIAASGTVPFVGSDGNWDADSAPNATGMTNGLIGDPNAKTGMYALLDVDLFNILCIPATMKLPDANATQVAAEAIALCTQRRAMYLLDAPQKDKPRNTPTSIMAWLDGAASLKSIPGSRNAALYFPTVEIADPLNDYRLKEVAPSGTIAGLWARTDATRSVWKAPAGTEAGLAGVQSLDYKLTDGENGVLNPLAINCLRNFPVYGPVCWGARTLAGADQIADDYKYIPVRRLALYIEESLFRGTQWVVFEPNAAPLWAQVRLNVGAFMQNLFRQGAFFGTTPQEAYFVLCDATNNPQNTINLGIINIAVGFAPLKPAEFVVIQIQQIAGQIAS